MLEGLGCSAVPLSAAVSASPFSSRRVGPAASTRPPLRFLFPLSVRRVRPPSASVRQTDIWRSCAIVLLAFPSSLSASLTRLLHFFARPKAETGHLGPPSLTRASLLASVPAGKIQGPKNHKQLEHTSFMGLHLQVSPTQIIFSTLPPLRFSLQLYPERGKKRPQNKRGGLRHGEGEGAAKWRWATMPLSGES